MPRTDRRIFQRAAAVHLVEAQADQRRALFGRTADGAADLLDGNRLTLLSAMTFLSSSDQLALFFGRRLRRRAAGLQRRDT